MMHWNSTNLTGFVASSWFCCLIKSSCLFAFAASYSSRFEFSARSTTSTSSSGWVADGESLRRFADVDFEIPAEGFRRFGEFGLADVAGRKLGPLRALRISGGGTIAGDESVRSTIP